MTGRQLSEENLHHYNYRSKSLWERVPALQQTYSDPNSAEYFKFVDTVAILYYRELQECGIAFPKWSDMVNVGGETDLRLFLMIGRACFDLIRPHLEAGEERKRVLDFGIGCGRTARHFYREISTFDVFGCDPDSSSINFLKDSAPFIEAAVSNNLPPLPYENDFFDYVYCISIFTHFHAESFKAWTAEMLRVLRPGGRILLTLHGSHALKLFQRPGEAAKAGVQEAEFQRSLKDYDDTGFMWCPQNVASKDVDTSQFGITFTDPDRLGAYFPSELKMIGYKDAAISGWQDLAIFQKL